MCDAMRRMTSRFSVRNLTSLWRLSRPTPSGFSDPCTAHGTHGGVQKTLQCLCALFYKLHANCLVPDFVQGCAVCQRNKTEHLHPAGLLQPWGVPSSVWVDTTMDLSRVFPKSEASQWCWSLLQYAHFTAILIALVFFDNIVRLHYVPCSNVSDRDPIFIRHPRLFGRSSSLSRAPCFVSIRHFILRSTVNLRLPTGFWVSICAVLPGIDPIALLGRVLLQCDFYQTSL